VMIESVSVTSVVAKARPSQLVPVIVAAVP
jgi:hypothetical protein